MAQPSIYDILNWQGDWERYKWKDDEDMTKSDMLSGKFLGAAPTISQFQLGGGGDLGAIGKYGGQKNMADYLMGLMGDAKLVPEDIGFSATETTGYDRGDYGGGGEGWETAFRESEDYLGGKTDIQDILPSIFGQNQQFQDMSREDLEALFTSGLAMPDWYKPEETISVTNPDLSTSKWFGGKWDEETTADMVNSLMGLQEGLGRVGDITEKFGLGKKLAGTEKKVERDVKSAYEGYIPGEILSRYGSLQGKGGVPQGEAAEAEYLSSISAADRRKGRDVRSIYGELEEEMFGGIGSWLETMM